MNTGYTRWLKIDVKAPFKPFHLFSVILYKGTGKLSETFLLAIYLNYLMIKHISWMRYQVKGLCRIFGTKINVFSPQKECPTVFVSLLRRHIYKRYWIPILRQKNNLYKISSRLYKTSLRILITLIPLNRIAKLVWIAFHFMSCKQGK